MLLPFWLTGDIACVQLLYHKPSRVRRREKEREFSLQKQLIRFAGSFTQLPKKVAQVTGTRARIAGREVAGKTGTAQKYDSNGGYDNKKYFSSFIGFLPVENPELLIGVMVDEPRWPYYGSQVAAPVFQRIAERTIQLSERALRVALSNETENKERKIGIKSDTPTYSIKATEGGKLIMPDLMGLSMRTTIHSIGKSFDNITILGSGYLKKQEPKSGTEITRDIPIILQFEETS